MARWRLSVLGGAAAARTCGATIPVPANCWPLFGYLLTLPRREAGRETIAAALWPDHESDAARHSLASALYRIRIAFAGLPSPVEAAGDGIVLRLGAAQWVDVVAFERRARTIVPRARGRSPSPAGMVLDPPARHRLHRALLAYGGDFLPSLDAEWALIERERLRCLRLDALYGLANLHADAGDWPAVVVAARALTTAEPLREDAQRLLMTGLARTGNRALALRQYRRCAAVLEAELNVTPMDETRALYRSLGAPLARGVSRPVFDFPSLDAVPAFDPPPLPGPATGDLRLLLVATRDQMRTALGLIDSAIGP